MLVHHQRIHAKPHQARSNGEPGLAAADHEHRGFAVLVGLGLDAKILPVHAAEVARVGLTGGPIMPHMFFEAFQFMQGGHDLESFRGLVRLQAQHAETATDGGLEREDCLEDRNACPLDAARRGASLGNGEAARLGGFLSIYHCGADLLSAPVRGDEPGEREHITPMAIIGCEQRGDGRLVPGVQGAVQR
jgi:hypothetical protein